MENRVPVPTDNIFKFYALFGLLLFTFSIGSVLYVTQSTNELIFATLPELEGLKQQSQPTPAEAARMAVLQKRLEISKSDKQFSIHALGTLAGIAALVGGYGFRRWHTDLQPVIDRTARVQLEIAELQLKKLQRELNPVSEAPAAMPKSDKAD